MRRSLDLLHRINPFHPNTTTTTKKPSASRPRSTMSHTTTTTTTTTTTNPPASTSHTADTLLQLAKARRTVYPLNKTLPVPASRIHSLVRDATLHTPSSFNSQSSRAVVLLGAEHDALWGFARDRLRAILPDDRWPATESRLGLFSAAAGTVLLFVDQDVVKAHQDKMPTFADSFPGWADQSCAMLQWLIWTALELDGMGANLQHYNPLIDDDVARKWDLPASWKLNAQIVFGGKAAEPGEKEFKPIEDRVKLFGA